MNDLSRGLFITGTDTGVGKTEVAAAITTALVTGGERVAVMKPVASGAQDHGEGLRNEDALTLMRAANVPHPYASVNPYCFEPAIAPHLAAARAGEEIDLRVIENSYEALARDADRVVVEGVGGWLVPLNENQSQADIAISLELPVVLVVGMRLGCLSHALLTINAIEQTGLKLIGWVANCADLRVEALEDNIAALTQRIDAPMLGQIPNMSMPISTEKVAACLDLSTLFSCS